MCWQTSRTTNIFCKTCLLDGWWHKVAIPLVQICQGKGRHGGLFKFVGNVKPRELKKRKFTATSFYSTPTAFKIAPSGQSLNEVNPLNQATPTQSHGPSYWPNAPAKAQKGDQSEGKTHFEEEINRT